MPKIKLDPREALERLILVVGPYRNVIISQMARQDAEQNMREMPNKVVWWVNEWVARRVGEINAELALQGRNPIKREPKLHLTSLEDHSKLGKLVAMAFEDTYDYGHFAVTSRPGELEAMWEAYKVAHKQGEDYLMEFMRIARHMMPATATLLRTGDRKMVTVRRSPGLFLHPGFIHSFGGSVEPYPRSEMGGNMIKSAVTELVEECGVRHEDITDFTCLGVSGNHPQMQPIFLNIASCALSEGEIQRVFGKAEDPDGPIQFHPFSPEEVRRMLVREDLTPSFRALLYLTQKGLEQGILVA